jgi:hypothetical protein
MAKHSWIIQIQKRRQDMDWILYAGPGALVLSHFAKKWNVTAETVERDLQWFRDQGQKIIKVRYEGEDAFQYAEGVRPILHDAKKVDEVERERKRQRERIRCVVDQTGRVLWERGQGSPSEV